MKIAQVVSTFPPYRGGMGNVAYCIADHLSRLKYEVTVFTPMHSLSDRNYKSFFKVHHLIPQFEYGNAAIVLQLFYRCFNYDIIHLHYPFIGGSIPLFILKCLRGKKTKIIVHYHMDLVGMGWRKIVFKIYNKLFLNWLLRLSDKIIVTSMDYANESIIAPILKKNPQKFVEISNGVDTDYFSPRQKPQTIIQKYRLIDKKIVLFVGGLDSSHYFKGVNYLIKAFQLLGREDVKLIIVGEGNLKSAYQDLVDSFGIANKIIFTGYVQDEELVNYYNLCDIFVLPSIDKSEAFGMVLLEAMACAKPVIATDLPGVREVVDRKINGRIVKPKDIYNLSEQINILLDDEAKRERYGNAGRKKVEEKYSWEKVIHKIINLYKEV